MSLIYLAERIDEIEAELDGAIRISRIDGLWCVLWIDEDYQDSHLGHDLPSLLEGVRIYVIEWRRFNLGT